MEELIEKLQKRKHHFSPKVIAIGTFTSLCIIALVIGAAWYGSNKIKESKGGEDVSTFSLEATSTISQGLAETDGLLGNDKNGQGALSGQPVTVYVSGHVITPGVYTLAGEVRIANAIEAAGGVSKTADLLAVNLAAQITDGQQLYVPGKKEVAKSGFNPLSMTVTGVGSGSGATGENAASSSITSVIDPIQTPQPAQPGGKPASSNSQAVNPARININSASAKELESLPGIGQVIAERILQDRSSNGAFTSVEDLMRVSGIGEKKFEALKDRVKIK